MQAQSDGINYPRNLKSLKEPDHWLKVRVRNSGDRYIYPEDLRLSAGGRDFPENAGAMIVLTRPIGPGAEETLQLPAPEDYAGEPVTISSR